MSMCMLLKSELPHCGLYNYFIMTVCKQSGASRLWGLFSEFWSQRHKKLAGHVDPLELEQMVAFGPGGPGAEWAHNVHIMYFGP